MSLAPITALYPAHVAELDRRYAGALASVGLDAVVLHGGVPLKKTRFDDQWWPLRATPHFHHWVPLTEPGSALVVRPGHAPLLATPSTVDFWEQPPEPESRHFEPHVARVSLASLDDLKRHLPSGAVGFVGDDEAQAARWGIERVNEPAVLAALDELRVHKTAYEVACLAEANRRAAAGHLALREAFFAGEDDELMLHLAYLRATGQDDPATPYKNIVARGAHAATLHHVSYARRVSDAGATSLLVDAGAGCLGYGSDITRTWARGTGAAADLYASLVAAVDALQQRLVAEARVGVMYEALHDRAHDLVGEALATLGIVRCSAGEAVASGVTRAFFPHGLGHSLGVQTHDVGCARIKPRDDNPFLRNTRRVEAGQVFTVEPGVYVIPGLLGPVREGEHAAKVDWAAVDALSPFGGVRVEDDLFITDEGAVNLTRGAVPELPLRA